MHAAAACPRRAPKRSTSAGPRAKPQTSRTIFPPVLPLPVLIYLRAAANPPCYCSPAPALQLTFAAEEEWTPWWKQLDDTEAPCVCC